MVGDIKKPWWGPLVFGGRLKYLNFWPFSAPIFSHCSNFWKTQCKYFFTYPTVTTTFGGVSQKCTQGAPPVKARNSQNMLKCKIAWNSIWQACTWQTAVGHDMAKLTCWGPGGSLAVPWWVHGGTMLGPCWGHVGSDLQTPPSWSSLQRAGPALGPRGGGRNFHFSISGPVPCPPSPPSPPSSGMA